MKIDYRIMTSRPDECPTKHSEPFFEGATIGECDEKAVKHLEMLAGQEGNSWDNLSLERIDIREKTTAIADNKPENHRQGAPRHTTFFTGKSVAQN